MAAFPGSDVKRLRQLWPLRPGVLHSVGASTLVMGILNVTPDSFSDGGLHDTVYGSFPADCVPCRATSNARAWKAQPLIAPLMPRSVVIKVFGHNQLLSSTATWRHLLSLAGAWVPSMCSDGALHCTGMLLEPVAGIWCSRAPRSST